MCNVDIKIAILKSGKKHYELAQQLRWHPSKLSTIISGVYIPSSMEMEDLARAVGCRVNDIFPSGKKEAADV